MMHGFQQIVTQAERRYNFVVHGLPPLRDEMAISPLIWRKRLMDSISSNLGYITLMIYVVYYKFRGRFYCVSRTLNVCSPGKDEIYGGIMSGRWMRYFSNCKSS